LSGELKVVVAAHPKEQPLSAVIPGGRGSNSLRLFDGHHGDLLRLDFRHGRIELARRYLHQVAQVPNSNSGFVQRVGLLDVYGNRATNPSRCYCASYGGVSAELLGHLQGV
jgi:hypothetical protein